MLADPNEVTAWVRITQDAAGLDSLIQKTEEKVQRLQTPRVSADESRRGLTAPEPSNFIHEQQHTMGGPLQPAMTGPAPSTIYTTSTAEQAIINTALLEDQEAENRLDSNQPAGVNITGSGEAEGYLPSEEAARKAAEEGKDPLAASAAARAGTSGGGLGVMPPVESTTEAEPADTGEGSGKTGPKTGTHSARTDKDANPGRSAKK
jgi:hypothetical protein